MRQKLIDRSTSPGFELSLYELMFNDNLTLAQWQKSFNKNRKLLCGFLLNSSFNEFNSYLVKSKQDLVLIDEEDHLSKVRNIAHKGINNINHEEILKNLLQTAILIEHSTIPPYLTALYSIKEGTNRRTSQVIRSVAVEEMLHMILVCNVMNALGIQPIINQPENYPKYPSKLPLNIDFKLNIEKFSKSSISSFITIESPSSSIVDAPFDDDIPPFEGLDIKLMASSRGSQNSQSTTNWEKQQILEFIENEIGTIGEYYDTILFLIILFQIIDYYNRTGKWPNSIDEINEGGIFNGDPKKQIDPDEYYGSGGTLFTVKCLKDIIKVFEEIKGQGEGGDGTLFTTDPSQFEEGFELAHYFRFKEIFHEHSYIGGNYDPYCDENGMMPIITPPVGRELKIDWNEVYPIKPNLKISQVDPESTLYFQINDFNLTYKDMLDLIQNAIEGNKDDLSKSILIMHNLKEKAIDIMKQNLDNSNNATPTFEYPIDL